MKTADIANLLGSHKNPHFSSLIGTLYNSCTGFVLCFMHLHQSSIFHEQVFGRNARGSSPILRQNLTSISSFDIEKSILVRLHGRDVIIVRLKEAG